MDERPFIGRDPELRQGRAALEAAGQGRAGALLVFGEAGVGKSRYVRQLARLAEADGWWHFTGRCVPLEVGQLPYGPVVEGFRALQHRGGLPAPLAEIFDPAVGVDLLTGADAGRSQGRLRIFESVLGLVAEASRRRPLMIVLEDVHWADGSTLDLLQGLAYSLYRQRVMVVVTCRSDGALTWRPPVGSVLEDLLRLAYCQKLELDRFDRATLAEFAASVRGEPMVPELLDQLLEQSDGNAFLAEELLG